MRQRPGAARVLSVGMGVAFQEYANTVRQRHTTTSSAGITRIRCEGLRSVPHSQPIGSPVWFDVNTKCALGSGARAAE
ncbi:hypothetical protein GCM10009853_033770 [Glycomyces scopariae]